MKYPVAVWVEGGVFSADVPDLPGVITEADSIEQLTESVEEAALGWMEAELDEGREIPQAAPVETYLKNEDYVGCIWFLVDVDMRKLSDKTERLNICLSSRAIRRLDALAKNAGESRSGFLSRMIYSFAK